MFLIEFFFSTIVITLLFKLVGTSNKVVDLKVCMNNEASRANNRIITRVMPWRFIKINTFQCIAKLGSSLSGYEKVKKGSTSLYVIFRVQNVVEVTFCVVLYCIAIISTEETVAVKRSVAKRLNAMQGPDILMVKLFFIICLENKRRWKYLCSIILLTNIQTPSMLRSNV